MQVLFIIFSLLFTSSIYDLQYNNIDGLAQSMDQYRGKKILIVNIATESSRVHQLAGLQQLHERYGDSLVIIGFPSNSFSHEPRDNEGIKQFCQSQYGTTFLLAEKNSVTQSGMQSIYAWLTTINENGVMGSPVGADFQKFLINESGQLIGVFSPKVDPLSPELTSAIEISQN